MDTKFVRGASGNPTGRPVLTPEVKAMRTACLEVAVKMMYEKLHDESYMKSLRFKDFWHVLNTVFERCGLEDAGDGQTGAIIREVAKALSEGVAVGLIQMPTRPEQPEANA